jgi:DNA modification methylase
MLIGKNPGDVWNINTASAETGSFEHFAVFPLELVRRPILAGCPPKGIVLDPFAGSGTVGAFCRHNERNAILFELNPEYKKLIEDRAMLLVPELSEWCSIKVPTTVLEAHSREAPPERKG